MGDKTKIQWADATWNPMTGCTPISEGCVNCYAAKMAKRLKAMKVRGYGQGFAVTLHPDRLEQPLKWKKPRRIFVCSMGDLFHEAVPDEFLFKIMDTIRRADIRREHQFLILTKRPARMLHFFRELQWDSAGGGRIFRAPGGPEFHLLTLLKDSVQLGVTAETQAQADARVADLCKIPLVKRYVSVEPMLEIVDLSRWRYPPDPQFSGLGIDQVIVGCESGPGHRMMSLDWVRQLRDDCLSQGTPFFFKQAYIDGKKISMPALDGKVWDELI